MSEYISSKLRKAVKIRAGNRCEYCQWFADYCITTYHIYHIVPLSRGGLTVPHNLAFSCGGCNGFKNNRTVCFDEISQTQAVIFNPREHSWNQHFEWSENFEKINGITKTGRATVWCLKLNRIELMNMRREFLKLGIHPPLIFQ